jgi:mono/diheme cytochrome c family protein
MNRFRFLIVVLAISGSCLATETLNPVSKFDQIADAGKRSVALFEEAGKVIISPRCLNCHPVDDSPRQGDLMRLHEPPVVRGAGGMGAAAMRCFTCHGATNFGRVPGNSKWFLAPQEMGWIGKSLGQICEQIKDRRRNGDRSVQQIVDLMANDDLVGWAWHPGADRTPEPGTQKEFGQLISAWVNNGAQCPKP